MNGMEWLLEVVLVFLLAATLFQAVRLERALGAMKRERSSLDTLVAGFNSSTHQAESGIQQMRAAADGLGRNIETQLSKSASLKDDLEFLSERGERLADRLEHLVRAARPMTQERHHEASVPKAVDNTERDLLNTLRMAR
jgi:hypothetical protein